MLEQQDGEHRQLNRDEARVAQFAKALFAILITGTFTGSPSFVHVLPLGVIVMCWLNARSDFIESLTQLDKL